MTTPAAAARQAVIRAIGINQQQLLAGGPARDRAVDAIMAAVDTYAAASTAATAPAQPAAPAPSADGQPPPARRPAASRSRAGKPAGT